MIPPPPCVTSGPKVRVIARCHVGFSTAAATADDGAVKLETTQAQVKEVKRIARHVTSISNRTVPRIR